MNNSILSRLRTLLSRIRSLFSSRRLDNDFEQELDSHLAMLTEDNIRQGLSPAEAKRAARLKLGNPAQLRETHHDQRTFPWLESLAQDLRFALRMTGKTPALTMIIVVTLALGIGANTAIFGIVNGALLRPLPVRAPEQIMALAIQQKGAPVGSSGFSYPEFVDFRAAGCAFTTGIVVGLVPALRTSKTNLNSVLREGGQRNSIGMDNAGLHNLLVVAQVAGSFTLLVAAGLFARSLQIVRGFRLGFEPDHVLNVILDPAQAGYDESRTTAFYGQIESRVRTLPGVKSASLASYVPMGGYPTKAAILIQGRVVLPGTQPPLVPFNRIDPAYFETMGVTLLRGRTFLDSDNKTSPRVAIVNRTMASTFWPQEDPIGKLFRLGSETALPVEVVGVAGNGKYLAINEDPLPFFYVPLAQDFVSPRALQIRAFAAPESLEVPVKEQIGQLAPGLSLMDIETMNQSLEGGLGYFAFRVSAICAALLGTVGLILAVVGVYGVVAFAASQRTREIGIRLALGASTRDILGLIWKQGVRLVIIGVTVGMISAWLLARTMTHLLAVVSMSDPATYIAVAILLSVVGLVACWIPARRAMRVDPMVALRHE